MANNKPGSICRRSDGNYVITFSGKKFVRAKEKDAQNLLKKLRNDFEEGLRFEDFEKITIEEAMKKWLLENRRKVKPTTFDRKEGIVYKQIIPRIGKLQVGVLTTKDVNDMLINLANDGYSYSVVKKAYNYTVQFYRDMKYLKKFNSNPFDDVIIPDANKRDMDDIVFYTKPEIDLMCNTATSLYTTGSGKAKPIYRLGYAFVIYAKTGIRSSEFMGLLWDDVDFKIDLFI